MMVLFVDLVRAMNRIIHAVTRNFTRHVRIQQLTTPPVRQSADVYKTHGQMIVGVFTMTIVPVDTGAAIISALHGVTRVLQIVQPVEEEANRRIRAEQQPAVRHVHTTRYKPVRIIPLHKVAITFMITVQIIIHVLTVIPVKRISMSMSIGIMLMTVVMMADLAE